MIKEQILDFIDKNFENWKKLRREFHQMPEIAMNEFDTSQKIKNYLNSLGFEVIDCGKTGVIGVFKNGDHNARKIAIRAEIDGLNIVEETGLDYASKNGNMHACGHDGHLTILLATCEYLIKTRDFNGTFYAIFQPGEETASGAKAMLNDSLLNKISPDRIYAIHNMPQNQIKIGELGSFFFYTGKQAMLSSSDNFEYEIIGKSGHGSAPQFTNDPIVAASFIILNLQTIVSRKIGAFDKVVITVGAFNAGNTFNIIPESAKLKISVRNLDQKLRINVLKWIDQYIENICNVYDCSFKKTIFDSFEPTVNDIEVSKFAFETVKELYGEDKVFDNAQTLGSEDFGLFLEKIPGCMAFIHNGQSNDVHSPKYIFNDELIKYGVSYFATIVEKELKNK